MMGHNLFHQINGNGGYKVMANKYHCPCLVLFACLVSFLDGISEVLCTQMNLGIKNPGQIISSGNIERGELELSDICHNITKYIRLFRWDINKYTSVQSSPGWVWVWVFHCSTNSAEDGLIGKYTEDGSVDIKGKPVLRASTGRWTASSFVLVYEGFERMGYYSILGNLIVYLTTKLHQGTVTAANSVTNWVGAVGLFPILGAYIGDAYLGRYWTFIISSSIYLSGLCLLTLAVSIPGLRPPQCIDLDSGNCPKASNTELGVFFAALYIIALGIGGTRTNLSTIGADQFDDFDPQEKVQKLSFFNWWMFTLFAGLLLGNTVLVYIQDNVSWTLGYINPSIGFAIGVSVFLIGTPFYRHKLPGGSPFTRMARVIVAALRKWNVPVPGESALLFEVDKEHYNKMGKFKIESTLTLKFLNKACVRRGVETPWMLCTVTEVEETKQILRLVPMLLTTFIPSAMIAQCSTLFIKQGTTLDKTMGNIDIPPASLGAFVALAMLVFVVLYDRVFVKTIRKFTKNPRGITLLQRMGIGYTLHIVIMTIASLTERYRLSVAKEHGLNEKPGQVPLTIFILLPQFVLMGMADAFTEVSRIEFFYDQAPESMKSLGTSFSTTSLGIGNLLSTFILSTVSEVTKENEHKGWILNNLNASHLDYYYAFLAILSAINFAVFLLVAKFFQYKAEVSDSMDVLKEELDRQPYRKEVHNT